MTIKREKEEYHGQTQNALEANPAIILLIIVRLRLSAGIKQINVNYKSKNLKNNLMGL